MPWSLSLHARGAHCTIRPDLGGRVWDLGLCVDEGRPQAILWNPGVNAAPAGVDAWWHGGCPLLFPFAGRVRDEDQSGHYRWQDEQWSMPLHGFGPRTTFDVIHQGPDSAQLQLRNGRDSAPFYGGQFTLTLTYQLRPDALRCEAKVENVGKLPLPLSLGWHPYFHTGVGAKAKEAQYDLGQLELSAAKRHFVTEHGMAAPGVPMPEEIIHLNAEEWRNTILTGAIQGKAQLKLAHSTPVELRWGPSEAFKTIVLWSDQPAYYCVEPWQAPPNAVNTGKDLMTLDTGADWSCWLEIAIPEST